MSAQWPMRLACRACVSRARSLRSHSARLRTGPHIDYVPVREGSDRVPSSCWSLSLHDGLGRSANRCCSTANSDIDDAVE